MSIFFDRVQAGSHLLAAAISLTLGLALVSSGSWCLHRVISVQNFIYFLAGYSAGRHQVSFEDNLKDIDLLLEGVTIVLKIACSLAIVGGLLQILSSIISLKIVNSENILVSWTVSTILSAIFSLTALVLPLSYGLRNFLELHVLFTVAGLNTFILVHLIAVVIVQIRGMNNAGGGDGDEEQALGSPVPSNPTTPPSSPAISEASLPPPPPDPKVTTPVSLTNTVNNSNAPKVST